MTTTLWVIFYVNAFAWGFLVLLRAVIWLNMLSLRLQLRKYRKMTMWQIFKEF